MSKITLLFLHLDCILLLLQVVRCSLVHLLFHQYILEPFELYQHHRTLCMLTIPTKYPKLDIPKYHRITICKIYIIFCIGITCSLQLKFSSIGPSQPISPAIPFRHSLLLLLTPPLHVLLQSVHGSHGVQDGQF